MAPIRTILWVGRARRFDGDLAADAPSLDVVWEPEIDAALRAPLDPFDAVVLDAEESPAALRALARMQSQHDAPPVLVRIDAADAARREELVAAGAADVVRWQRGREEEAVGAALATRIEAVIRSRSAAPAESTSAIVGASRAVRELLALVERAGRTRTSVLISGETGTGKELVARAIHAASARRRRAFVAFNCAAFPETLLESELFGHAKGSFTGADREHKGLFAEADRGTLFLDEISETSPAFQAKLLRALQEGEVRALGSTRSRRVDVRVIAASNRDLWADAEAGRFREDLLYRLAVFPVPLPPLRERAGDVRLLAEFFLAHHGGRDGVPGVTLAPAAIRALERYPWPGNVRELENEIRRALALAEPGATLAPDCFSQRVRAGGRAVDTAARPGETLRGTLHRIEAALLREALAANDGRRTTTARQLGITREGLYKKMRRLGIE